MAFCSNCGSPVDEKFAFCTSCGAKIAKDAPVQDVEASSEQTEVIVENNAPAAEEPIAENTVQEEVKEVETVEEAPAEEAPEEDTPMEAAPVEETPSVVAETEETPAVNLAATNVYEAPPAIGYTNVPPVQEEPQLPLGKDPVETVPNKKGEFGVVGTCYYFFMTLLYLVPLVGLVMAIVMSFGGTVNRSKRGFARAVLIYKIIGIVVLLSALIALIFLQNALFEMLSEYLNEDIYSWSEVFDLM